jgi:DegV family protein with EDD domain
VWRTAEAIANGAGADAAAALVESLAARTEVLVAVRSLDAMVRGGRVSPLKGLAARTLGLLPIISLDREGRSCMRGKAFSFEGAVERILRRLAGHARHLHPERWAVSHAGAEQAARRLQERAADILDSPPAYLMDTSPIIGAHAGTGSVCISVQWSDVPD